MKQNIRKLLIANRGEIASRIIKTARDKGIFTTAIFASVDKDLPFVAQADQAIQLDGTSPAATYNNLNKIISIALQEKVDAIHPGYGFLSENSLFAQSCQDNNILFVGPTAKVIEQMGRKDLAKSIANKLNIPIIPGYSNRHQELNALKQEAKKIGYPLLIKAVAGGGGKGIKVVQHEEQLTDAIMATKREVANAFGDDSIMLEQFFSKAKHIEVQIMADNYGNVIHLFERECSIQRRYQKIIEEAPSTGLPQEVKEAMYAAAVKLMKHIAYRNAGTVEFLVDSKNKFYFLEVNTRLQVEHPVTEMITGLDMVALQLEIASGISLALKQQDIKRQGHAIECRIYAENTHSAFSATSGKIVELELFTMPELRFDNAIKKGNQLGIHYDPLISKAICQAHDRETCINKLSYALKKTILFGTHNNLNLLAQILDDATFIKGNYTNDFLTTLKQKTANNIPLNVLFNALAATTIKWCLRAKKQQPLLQELPINWSNNPSEFKQFINFIFEGKKISIQYEVNKNKFTIVWVTHQMRAIFEVIKNSKHRIKLLSKNKLRSYRVLLCRKKCYVHHPEGYSLCFEHQQRFQEITEEKTTAGYTAPITGEVTKLLVGLTEKVKKGTPLLIIMSMKIENVICANENGTVKTMNIVEGQIVKEGETLLEIVDD